MIMARKSKRIYLNKKQQIFLQAIQATIAWMGGRGTGKSSIEGFCQYDCFVNMPRAKTFFSSSTFAQMLTKTLPAVIKIWEAHGLKEHIPGQQNGHYVIGRRPPSNWETCRQPPKKYMNVITFFNGYTIELLSMDRPDLARGGSYDGGGLDEAYNVKEQDYSRILLPSIRGNEGRYKTHRHQQLRLYFSVPWMGKGDWLYKLEEKAKSNPDEVFWMESRTEDNIAVIGEKAFRRMKDSMNYLDYLVECENQRFTKSIDPYYYSFDDTHHTYRPQYLYKETERGIAVEGIKSIKKNGPIDICFDFGGYFNCLTVWEELLNMVYMTNSFSTDALNNENVDKLVRKFCVAYADNKTKHVNIYGEYHGKDERAEGESLYDRVIRIFNSLGWSCDLCVTEPAGDTMTRREIINEFYAETNPDLPKVRFNVDTCRDPIISHNLAKTKHDGRKSKLDEKNRSANQAHATHFTDNADYYLLQKFGHRLGLIVYRSRGRRAGVA